jgi:uncharacterized damage-inducible protein DinB
MAVPEVAPSRRLLTEAIERVIAATEGLDTADVNWHPHPDASSLAALALHILGATEENVMTSLTRTRPTDRNRDDEFAAREETGASLAARWAALRPEIEAAMDVLTAEDLMDTRAHPRFGEMSGRDMLDRLVTHAFEHAGQAELTRQLLDARPA